MSRTMRIILQNRRSRLYFVASEQWTANIAQAADFQQVLTAIEFVRENKPAHVDIVMTFGESRYDVRIAATP